MDHDSTTLTEALATRRPPAIAAALRAGTALVPSTIAPAGDERVVVAVDDQERRVLRVFSCRSALSEHVLRTEHDGRYRVAMSVTPADLQLALDQAGAVGAAPPDNPALLAALVGGGLGEVAAALAAGTVIVPARSAREGGEIAQIMTPDGRRALYGFPTADVFAAWVQKTGDDGDHRAIGGAGLGVLAQELGVDGVPAPERRGFFRRRTP